VARHHSEELVEIDRNGVGRYAFAKAAFNPMDLLIDVIVRPDWSKITSFGDGSSGMLIDDPAMVITKSPSVLKPVAEGVPSTDDVEPTAVAVMLKIESASKSRVAKLDDAVPVAVAVSPSAVSINALAEKFTGPRLPENEASELVTL